LGRRRLEPHLVGYRLRQFQLQIGDALAVRAFSRRQRLFQRAGQATLELHAVHGPFRLDLLTLGLGCFTSSSEARWSARICTGLPSKPSISRC
jgi:hypothetical protein